MYKHVAPLVVNFNEDFSDWTLFLHNESEYESEFYHSPHSMTMHSMIS